MRQNTSQNMPQNIPQNFKRFSSRLVFTLVGFSCIVTAEPLFAQAPDATSRAATSSAAPSVSPSPATAAATLLDKPCILVGRLNTDNRWAPLARGVTLLNAQGERINASSKKALDTVKAVRLSEPAWLSQCNANQPFVNGDSSMGSKTPAPTVKPGATALNVEAINYPPGRVGGQWVELQLALPADRVVTAAR